MAHDHWHRCAVCGGTESLIDFVAIDESQRTNINPGKMPGLVGFLETLHDWQFSICSACANDGVEIEVRRTKEKTNV